jgi:hypothetical protein
MNGINGYLVLANLIGTRSYSQLSWNEFYPNAANKRSAHLVKFFASMIRGWIINTVKKF